MCYTEGNLPIHAELNRLARALYRNACRLEEELDGPQDIEWAIAGGRRSLESALRELVGADDANALLSNLSGLSSPLESLGAVIGLGKVARVEMSRDACLEAYGHRGVNENESAWPRPLEDPAWLDRQLVEFAKAPVEIEALIAKQQAAFTAAWERFCERHPRKVKSMRLHLRKAAQAAHQREAVRSEATRCSIVIRAFALRAGELTGVGEDVFFVTIDKVLWRFCRGRGYVHSIFKLCHWQ